MQRIDLISLTIENFRSFQKRTTITFSQDAGLKFICGDNQAQPRLGSNGVGKSTLWDALCWCLYGVSVKGLRSSELVSWGEKQPYVCATFQGDEGEEVEVERYGNPNKLLLANQPVAQENIDAIFLSRTKALQCVIFGQAAPLFIDLSMPERGLLLDDVLDLGIWLRASDTASAQHKLVEAKLVDIAKQHAFLEGKLAALPNQETLLAQSNGWDQEQGKRIDSAILQVEEAENQIPILASKLRKAKSAVATLPKLSQDSLRIKERQKATLESEYQRWFREEEEQRGLIKFYSHNKTCPTCKQAISHHSSEATIRGCQTRMSGIRSEMTRNGLASRQVTQDINTLSAEYSTLSRKRDFLLAQVVTAESELSNQSRIVDAAVRAVEVVAEAANPYSEQLRKLAEDTAAIQNERKSINASRLAAQAEAMKLEFWQAAFKRVRLFLVGRILLQLEIEVASAALALGLVGWKITFTTEIETKSGTLRPGIHVQVSSPTANASWESWSGGEAQRIRLAVTLGLASMIQRLAGVVYNFEVWDEPTQFLSSEGIEDLMDCLRHRVETTGKSVWLCDHRALQTSSFNEVWQVSKTNEGSSISLLSRSES